MGAFTLKPSRPQNRPLHPPPLPQLPQIPVHLAHGRPARLDRRRALQHEAAHAAAAGKVDKLRHDALGVEGGRRDEVDGRDAGGGGEGVGPRVGVVPVEADVVDVGWYIVVGGGVVVGLSVAVAGADEDGFGAGGELVDDAAADGAGAAEHEDGGVGHGDGVEHGWMAVYSF